MNDIQNFEYRIINEIVAVITLPQFIVSGEEAMSFTNLLNEIIDKKPKAIVADLSKVEFMNSTGLGLLAGAHNNLSKNSLPFYIVNSNDKIMKLFKMTHLSEVFKLDSNLESILSIYSK